MIDVRFRLGNVGHGGETGQFRIRLLDQVVDFEPRRCRTPEPPAQLRLGRQDMGRQPPGALGRYYWHPHPPIRPPFQHSYPGTSDLPAPPPTTQLKSPPAL